MGVQDNSTSYEWHQRFGSVIAKRGVSPAPTAIYEYQQELKLTATEVWFIMYILSHKWSGDLPYPSIEKMALKSGVSKVTLHSYKKSLVSKNYLIVIARSNSSGGQSSNAYDFTPLFRKLEELIIRDTTDNNEDECRLNTPPLKNGTPPVQNTNTPPLKNGTGSVKKLNTNNNPLTEQSKKEEIEQQTSDVLLFEKFSFNEKSKKDILDKFPLNRIQEVLMQIEKNSSNISNPEGFLISALQNNYQFDREEKLKKMKSEERKSEEKKIEMQDTARKQIEDMKKQQVQDWIDSHQKEWDEILSIEKAKYANSPLFKNNDFLAQVNAKIHVRKSILEIE